MAATSADGFSFYFNSTSTRPTTPRPGAWLDKRSIENAVVRGRARQPLVIGDDILVGPHAHVNGARVADGCFLATGTSLFRGSVARARARPDSAPAGPAGPAAQGCRTTRPAIPPAAFALNASAALASG
jgi:acetyltransferase-like isoleucine patch superfamily enzyme